MRCRPTRRPWRCAADDARLLADYADTLALKNNRNLEGEPMKLVERALKIEPTNLKALSLAGAAAFNRQDYAGAVRYWEQVAKNAPPDSPYLPQVQSSIAEARERGGLGSAAVASGQAARRPPRSPQPSRAAAQPADRARCGGRCHDPRHRAPGAGAGHAGRTHRHGLHLRAAGRRLAHAAGHPAQAGQGPAGRRSRSTTAWRCRRRRSCRCFPKVVISARVTKSGQAVPAPRRPDRAVGTGRRRPPADS